MYSHLIFLSLVLYLVIDCNGANVPQIYTEEKIVGGAAAKIGDAPYQVSLRRYKSHFCGGSIITTKTVVTAAHCVVGQSPSAITVVVGSTTLNAGGVKHEVESLRKNENYDSSAIINDIAVVIVVSPFKYNEFVKPISLPEGYTDGGVTLTLTGWGTTSYPGTVPNNLQIIKLRSLSFSDCRNRFGNEVHESQICTLTRIGQGACHGDSGGPLAYENTLIGVVSWGYPCAKGYPDVFTRVSSFIDWIKQNQVE